MAEQLNAGPVDGKARLSRQFSNQRLKLGIFDFRDCAAIIANGEARLGVVVMFGTGDKGLHPLDPMHQPLFLKAVQSAVNRQRRAEPDFAQLVEKFISGQPVRAPVSEQRSPGIGFSAAPMPWADIRSALTPWHML